MGTDHYFHRWLHKISNQDISFEGQALQPRLAPDGTSIDFELVANRTSTMMRFDPSTRRSTPLPIAVPANPAAKPTANRTPVTTAASPNRKWIAFESAQDRPT